MEKVNLCYSSPHDWTMFDDNAKRISQQRAQIVLPILVERARRRKTISFGDLAKRFDMKFALPIHKVVVCIGGTLYLLERNELPQAKFKWEHGRIPRITNMVIKANREPAPFVKSNLEDSGHFQRLLNRVYDYKHWDEVLEALGL